MSGEVWWANPLPLPKQISISLIFLAFFGKVWGGEWGGLGGVPPQTNIISIVFPDAFR